MTRVRARMRIVRLEISGFRNIVRERIEPGPGMNVFYGENAQGKTSLLEAIYVLGRARSFRTSRLADVQRYPSESTTRWGPHGDTPADREVDWGAPAVVRGLIERRGSALELAVQIGARSSAFFVGGKRRSLAEYMSHLAVFVCSLERMEIIRGEPEHRRHFLDDGVLTLDPKYAHTLHQYQRVLKQKNRLLKLAAESDDPRRFIEEIEVWNQQLVRYGALIHRVRTRYVEQLQAHLPHDLFESERIAIRYVSALEAHGGAPHTISGSCEDPGVSQYEALLAERLRVRLPAELALGHALVGPHRDEVEITLNGRDLRRSGSLGQQRSALIMLDLAQLSVYNSAFEDRAVFLLDDVDAAVDRRRIARIMDYLHGRAQCFLTTSKEEIARTVRGRVHLFQVEAGRVRPLGVPMESEGACEESPGIPTASESS